MPMIYRFLDDRGDCIFAVVVREGGTLVTITPSTVFRIVEGEHDGSPFPTWVPNKFSGWRVDGECEYGALSEDTLGPSAVVEFGTLPWIDLNFTQKRAGPSGSDSPVPSSKDGSGNWRRRATKRCAGTSAATLMPHLRERILF